MSSTASPALFRPIKLRNITLSHRIVLAPMTRYRAGRSDHVPVLPMVGEYYSQRSRIPGTLLITEGTFIAVKAGGYHNVPGIWSEEQVAAWKTVVEKVHANRSYIFLQLWALGRTAHVDILKAEDSSAELLAPSPNKLSSRPTAPREMTVAEIQEFIQLHVEAAKNAIHKAGFDGVEIHGANGYLIEQFLQDITNQRTDGYGGSIEGRSRFGLEVVDAVVDAIGPEKTGIRLSPWSAFQDMGMADPVPQYAHFVTMLKSKHPRLAYLHVVEPRIGGPYEIGTVGTPESNNFIRKIWEPCPYISAGGYTRETALKTADEKGGLIAFGRFFTSNPDLPDRLMRDVALSPYERKTFFTPGDQEGAEIGYIDYPCANIQSKIN